MIRRQSNNQCSGGIAAHLAPKNFECKSFWEKFSPRSFGIKTTSTSLIIFHRAKLSTRSINHLCWCNWRKFWRKNAAGISPRWSCSCTTMPRLIGHLQPRRNWLTWASNVLITHHILHLAPSDYHLFPGLKKLLKGCNFSSDAEVFPAAEIWLDGQTSDFFLSALPKLEQQAKKFIELCGEYVEYIPSLIAVVCFLPGRAKDLSVPTCRLRKWSFYVPVISFCTTRFKIQKFYSFFYKIYFWESSGSQNEQRYFST